jgi:hypothetical protein
MNGETDQKLGIKEKKEIIGILMESSFYFELSLEERELLVQSILAH